MANCKIHRMMEGNPNKLQEFLGKYSLNITAHKEELYRIAELCKKYRKNVRSPTLIREYLSQGKKLEDFAFATVEEKMNESVDIEQYGTMLEVARLYQKMKGNKKIAHVHANNYAMGVCDSVNELKKLMETNGSNSLVKES